MPDLTPAHESLHRLLGTWEGNEKLTGRGSAAGRVTYRAILGGLALSQEYVQTRADGSVFELHGVLTVHPESGEVVWYSFDSFLPAPDAPAKGEWYGSTLGLEKVTPGGTARHRLTVAGRTLNHVIATAPAIAEGAAADEDFQVFMDGTYTRQ